MSPYTKAWLLWVVGIILVTIGAGAMEYYHSMLPMALGSATGLMLMWPVIKLLSEKK